MKENCTMGKPTSTSVYKVIANSDEPILVLDAEKVPDEDPYQIDEDEDPDGRSLNRAAAAACAAMGCILGGPILALLGGWFGAHTAKHSSGAVGDATRSAGEVAMAAHAKAKEERIYEKSRDSVRDATESVGSWFRGLFSSKRDCTCDGSRKPHI